MENLQDILISKRNNLKLSLREAANLIGISHSYLNTLEKGFDPRTGAPIKPTPETLMLISEAYNIDYNILMELCGYIKVSLEYIYGIPNVENRDKAEEILLIFQNRLKELRKEKELTQEDLDNILNLQNTTISKYELGERKLDQEILAKLAEYFNTTTDYLLGNSDIRNPYKEDNKEKYKDIHDIEEAMKVILEQPGLMLKGTILSDESKIILANAIQMGLRTAEELEKKKGDNNE